MLGNFWIKFTVIEHNEWSPSLEIAEIIESEIPNESYWDYLKLYSNCGSHMKIASKSRCLQPVVSQTYAVLFVPVLSGTTDVWSFASALINHLRVLTMYGCFYSILIDHSCHHHHHHTSSSPSITIHSHTSPYITTIFTRNCSHLPLPQEQSWLGSWDPGLFGGAAARISADEGHLQLRASIWLDTNVPFGTRKSGGLTFFLRFEILRF